MAKKFFSGRCVHCLKYCDELTSDHVFPQAWYPSNISLNLKKWQAPSCLDCNQKYGEIENALLIRLGMGVNPNNPITANIAKKTIRAMNSAHGKNERDKKHRLIERIKTIKNLIPRDKIRPSSILPTKNLSESDESKFCLSIPADSLRLMGEKFIRGIIYVLENKYIEPTHQIDIYIREEQDAQQLMELIEKYGKEYSCSGGIIIRRATAEDDYISGVYYIEIWNKFYFYGSITPNV